MHSDYVNGYSTIDLVAVKWDISSYIKNLSSYARQHSNYFSFYEKDRSHDLDPPQNI